MQISDRSQALLDLFRQGLSYFGHVQSLLSLGERQAYVGMSDIAHYSECPRAAIAAKLYPIQDNLSSQLSLQRGHWFEKGVGDSLASLGLNILPQLEISLESQASPIKAHLDYTLAWNRPKMAVRVLEVKSMGNIPESPYAQHELQISGQVALLQKFWNRSVFSIRDNAGTLLAKDLSFPEICHKCLGISLPENTDKLSIEGWLMCLSMKDAAAFGPYGFSQSVLEAVMNYGTRFWQEMQAIQNGDLALNDLAYVGGFYPLCQYCPVNSDCPRFGRGSLQPQLEDSIVQLDDLKRERMRIDESIKTLEATLKHIGSMCSDSG